LAAENKLSRLANIVLAAREVAVFKDFREELVLNGNV